MVYKRFMISSYIIFLHKHAKNLAAIASKYVYVQCIASSVYKDIICWWVFQKKTITIDSGSVGGSFAATIQTWNPETKTNLHTKNYQKHI